MLLNLVRNTAFVSVCLGFSVFPLASSAEDTRTVNGVTFGSADWKKITLNESDFRGSAYKAFIISQRKLPDRIQESWRDPRNQQNGPLVTMFYERLHTSYFSDISFDNSFEKILRGAFVKHGASIDGLEFERIGRAFKGTFVSYGNTTCFASLRIAGRSSGDLTGFTGDESSRVFVCDHNSADRTTLKNIALSFYAGLQRDGRSVRVPSGSPSSYETASAALFYTSPTHTQTKVTNTENNDGWQTRPIAIRWQGISDLVAGEISFRENNRSGKMKATIPGSGDACEGTYQLGAGQTGSWAMACTNALTAAGTFTAFGAGKGSSGSGTDSRGNAINFTIGGR